MGNNKWPPSVGVESVLFESVLLNQKISQCKVEHEKILAFPLSARPFGARGSFESDLDGPDTRANASQPRSNRLGNKNTGARESRSSTESTLAAFTVFVFYP